MLNTPFMGKWQEICLIFPPRSLTSYTYLQQTETSKQSKTSKTDEDEVLGELSKLYESEETVSVPINAKLALLVDKMDKTSLSEEKTKESMRNTTGHTTVKT